LANIFSKNILSILAGFATFFALGVIGLGAFTRLLDAGLGCPDWPLCYGHLLAPINSISEVIITHYPAYPAYKAWAEMIHRYFAGTLGCLIIIIFIITLKKNARYKSNLLLSSFLLILLFWQIMLGQWTVTYKLLPIVVTGHLLGGFAILSILWLIYLNNNSILFIKLQSDERTIFHITAFFASIGLILLLIQIFLGAWTSTHYAALSCTDFPLCQNNQAFSLTGFSQAFTLWTPVGINYEGGILSDTIRQTIQMVHRIGALILTAYLLLFAMIASVKLIKFPKIMQSIYILLALLVLQLCIGMMNVLFKRPLVIAICHNLVASLLLLALITLIFKLFSYSKKIASV